MQLQELIADIKDEIILLIRDYLASASDDTEKDPETLLYDLTNWSSDEMLSLNTISKALGHGGSMNTLDLMVSPRGYRILKKIPRLPMPVIENLVDRFTTLMNIIAASPDELDDVDGIGEVGPGHQRWLKEIKGPGLA